MNLRTLLNAQSLLMMCVVWTVTITPSSATATPKLEFKKTVRPLLMRHCVKCHGPSKQKSGLRLDVKDAAIRGGDHGPVIVPGHSDQSRLIELVAGRDPDLRMPLEGRRLTKAEVDLLQRWIDAGAPWPREEMPAEIRSDHWSFQPVHKPSPPDVHHPNWPRNAIDHFVLARLEAAGLSPAPEADRATLIRRLSYDLTGLPPSPQAIEAFVNDPSPDAYEKLVDHLLASPRYGERWARHWLDVARYTESQGFEYDRPRDRAWHYRDYVINSLNHDKPYDRFVMEQIAGDVLEPVTSEGIIATSLLVCGPWDQAGNAQANATQRAITREQELEDLVSVVGQGFLGVTINCARCHSHKFDPIPQKDYYRMKAVFEGVVHGERAILPPAQLSARARRLASLHDRVEKLRGEISEIDRIGRNRALASNDTRPDTTSLALPRPVALWTFETDGRDEVGALHGKVHGGATITRGRLRLNGIDGFFQTEPLDRDIREKTLEVWVTLDTLDQRGGGAITIESSDGGVFDSIVFSESKPRKWMAGSNRLIRSRDLNAPKETAEAGELVHLAIVYDTDNRITVYRNGEPYGKPYTPGAPLQIYTAGHSHILMGRRHTGGARPWLKGEIEQAALYDRALTTQQVEASVKNSGLWVSHQRLLANLSTDEIQRRDSRLQAIKETEAAIAAIPPIEKSYVGMRRQPKPTRRLLRGNVSTPAEVVSPAALSVIRIPSGEFHLPPDAPEAERRLRLARWIADPRNPLTPRVMANRVWHYHFGRGIVATPNDFGSAGAPPTHPQLLDWLASTFVENGWSLKQLHRLIVTSATYRQGSGHNTAAAGIDADNKLLWHFAPRRLEGEAIRDAMLMLSGEINFKMDGPSFRPFDTSQFGATFYHLKDKIGPEYNRRTIYRMNINSGKDPLLDAFDCPEPSVKTPRRRTTTTPLQALSLMNNSFVQRQTRLFADRVMAQTHHKTKDAINLAYRYAFGRHATKQELDAAQAVAHRHGMHSVCWAILNASEFLYVR